MGSAQATSDPKVGADSTVTDPAAPARVPDLVEIERTLVRAVRRVCPPAMMSHLDDLVQQALLRVNKILATREGLEPLSSSYLWKVAYSTMVDELRKVRSQENMRSNLVHARPKLEELSPESALAGREIGSAIQACLRTLIETRRRAVLLHLQGHSVPETSQLLGWTRKRAENQVYRGLADLRACLTTKGFAP